MTPLGSSRQSKNSCNVIVVAWHRWADEPGSEENEIHCVDPTVPHAKIRLANAVATDGKEGHVYQFIHYKYGSTAYGVDFPISVKEHDAVRDRASENYALYLSKYGSSTAAPSPNF